MTDTNYEVLHSIIFPILLSIQTNLQTLCMQFKKSLNKPSIVLCQTFSSSSTTNGVFFFAYISYDRKVHEFNDTELSIPVNRTQRWATGSSHESALSPHHRSPDNAFPRGSHWPPKQWRRAKHLRTHTRTSGRNGLTVFMQLTRLC
jgi:hypothetical protein